jgi:predicted transcriptional regulator
MTYHKVADENLKKVEAFFVRRAKELGSHRMEATVVEIAEGSEVALATAHKAIQQLQKDKVIDVIKPKSRRFAITYIYKKDIEGFEVEQEQDDQLQYLLNLNEEYRQEIARLTKELSETQGQKHVLESQLKPRAK